LNIAIYNILPFRQEICEKRKKLISIYYVRKIALLIFLFIFVSVSCKRSQKNIVNFDYNDFSNLTIKWSDFFNQPDEQYYVYFYSEQCGYCKMIKQDILGYISQSKSRIYLLSYQEGIPIKLDVERTVGAISIDQMWFGGTPSLVFIEKGVVGLNLLGAQSILMFLNST